MTYFMDGRALRRDVFSVVRRVICVKVVGTTSSERLLFVFLFVCKMSFLTVAYELRFAVIRLVR